MDRLANRALGRLEVHDRAALQAERALMADADDAGQMGAAAQRLGGLDRQQLRDEADDLARADVQNGQRRAPARGGRLETGRQPLGQQAHLSAPLPRVCFFFIASVRAEAASSVNRTTTRSDMRRSTAITSLSRIFCSRSSLTSRATAPAPPSSGRGESSAS